MNKLELLRTFQRVTELSSFTQAAESLGLPRSTVSEQVRDLERLLDARLLHRTTRRVRPTQDGQALYQRGRELLAQMDELEHMFRHETLGLSGRLRVDMPTEIARRLVAPRLQEFLAPHPALEIELGCSDRRVEPLREGFDCVLRIGAVDDDSLVARCLGQLSMVNCASPAYLAAHGTPESLDDLAQHSLIHYVTAFGTRPEGFEYLRNGKLHRLAMAGRVTVNNIDAYEGACLGGLGIIQAPLIGMRSHLQSGRLLRLLDDWVAAPMPVHLLHPHGAHLPRRVRAFMDWLEALMAEEFEH
ncbi:LysR family transcriptional regulator [Pseudomonas sp. NCHU5208]|uniref:LysR family transcriptional regulator n=1 Tax=unclassified Pseudomonas TaxID=196821 RepID=UPI003F9906D9